MKKQLLFLLFAGLLGTQTNVIGMGTFGAGLASGGSSSLTPGLGGGTGGLPAPLNTQIANNTANQINTANDCLNSNSLTSPACINLGTTTYTGEGSSLTPGLGGGTGTSSTLEP